VKYWVTLLLTLLFSACEPEAPLIRICGLPCAQDKNGFIVTGDEALEITCHTGILSCADDRDDVCLGWRLPSEEQCEDGGVDQDCDGYPDNISYLYFQYENDCRDTQIGICRLSNKVCFNDTWTCVPPRGLYGSEICDGIDNDCDGLVDSEDPDLVFEDDEWVYEGPIQTLNVGECRAGHRTCDHGYEYIFGQVLPTTEICGNLDDDDCDGLEDEDDSITIAEAFLLPIDFSGSMWFTIEAVIDSLCDWAGNSTFTFSQFAIVAVGGGSWTIPYIDLITDFTTADEACNALTDYYIFYGTPGGVEYIPHSILASQSDSTLGVTWPSDMTRRIIFFTDEMPQGYLFTAETELDLVAEDCIINDYTVSGFTNGQHYIWSRMTNPCSGWLENLSSDPDDMRAALEYRFGTEC
jgi:hypothetical protein